jgi:hypothetical protein
MRTTKLIPLLAVVAACGSNLAGNNAASDDAAALGRPIDLEGGSWRSEITVLAFEEPGGPDPDGSVARQTAERLSGRNRCFSREAMQNANLPESLSSGPWLGGNCTYSRRLITTTGVDIAMTCEGIVPGHRLETTVRGTATPREANVIIENRSRHPRTGEAWTERYRVRSTWLAATCERQR